MRITIESIDTESMQKLGYMQVPSFLVKYRSSTCTSEARLVPAHSDVQQCLGQVYEVEVNQESVSDFSVVVGNTSREAIVAMSERTALRVTGVVTSIMQISEPPGEQMITVRAEDAFFTLSRADTGFAMLSVGDKISFVAHEVSLWDEEI